ncbi:hypothetical protein M406DRAFT_261262 [Cryphonectria parasitica EP155]|uniref:Mtf2-like C-terminal domain-containing protein n=1 Tax=Cryphonectria parasitica (strain ATCC 38755 / EP155) TaxID=660469 RepID=A0A9P5CNH1_CRYP1|nr:uncharacterized protein M406DRAFT_261262 [Cryphonectria parasitica EP155]KAF3763910.1 hypothetical protein M406DRAFT_261262 [Cryphonectria parasitica EP155]
MPTTLTPFLYQTGTLSRCARAAVLRSSFHTTSRRRKYEDDIIPFELPPDLENPTKRQGRRQDTITPTERLTFENIFKEIAQKGRKPKLPKSTPTKSQDEDSRDQTTFNVNSIMEDAASRYSKAQPSIRGLHPLSPLDATYSAAEREKALLRFPPTLRQAARMAFGMFETVETMPTVQLEGGRMQKLGSSTELDPVETVGAGSGVRSTGDQLAKTLEIEARRGEERLRIKTRMDAAKDDFELWDALEHEVFPLVHRLGIKDSPPNPAFKPRKVRRSRKKELQGATHAPLDMEVYGPIYPQLLLEGLEMLDTKFARPSPYVAHLLPRVKELGLVSYVLGVSTSFYNRLMKQLWNRYGDAQGVLNLLEEMRHAGLYFDEESKSVVHRIEMVYKSADEGAKDFFAAKLMDMPEFEPILAGRLSHWVSHIDRSIKERRLGLGF